MSFTDILGKLNDIAWGPWMLILLVGTGVFMTWKLGFLQFRKFGYAMKQTLGKIFSKQSAGSGEVTPFQAVSTALAATVGTGNIAGVTGAIAVGGPGAVFWMWASALFGMATKYSEVVLAVQYRERNPKGDYVGGPMYYIKNGMGKKWTWLAMIFSLLAAIAAINAIPERVTYAHKDIVEAARAAYNKVASKLQQSLVTNYDVLVSAEQRISALAPKDEAEEKPPVDEVVKKGAEWLAWVVIGLGVVGVGVAVFFDRRGFKKAPESEAENEVVPAEATQEAAEATQEADEVIEVSEDTEDSEDTEA